MSLTAGIETLAGHGRERRGTLSAILALTVLGWAYLWFAPMPMPSSSGGLRTAHYAAFTFAMWFVMMVAMMTPSAAPTLLLYDRVQRVSGVTNAPQLTASFLAGYLLVWAGFSAVATLLQIALIAAAWIDDMAVATHRVATALLLFAVGVYQWLPIKRACLDRCQSPAEFIATFRKPGRAGALQMGLRHGAYCVGCCWALMLLLFVGGVMNLAWVACITVVVLAEKLVVRGSWLRHGIAVAAILAAGAVLAGVFQPLVFR